MIPNSQLPEPRDHRRDGSVEVHSIFATIQGEGPFTGRPAIFVRLAGCNLQCPGCDTEYTATRKRMDVIEVLKGVQEAGQLASNRASLIVITGGEPFRQNIYPLIDELEDSGYTVQVETNGSMKIDVYQLSDDAIIVCSPKTSKLHPSLRNVVSAYKYVVTDGNLCPEDGLPLQALGHPATPKLARPEHGSAVNILVQPRDEQDEISNARNLEATLLTACNHNYTVQLQIHKLLKVE